MDNERAAGTEAEKTPHGSLIGLSQRQGGFVTRSQLLEAGFGRNWVQSQWRQGRLIRVHQGVYAVGHVPTEPRARAFGAMLAAGDHAALMGRSAAAFYGFFRRWEEPFELLSPRRCQCQGIVVRRCGTLAGRDVWRFDGLRVTSPARTSLDLAAQLTEYRLKAAVEHLRLRHGMKVSQLRDVLARNPQHPGALGLRVVIGDLSERPSRSGFERQWPAFARRFNLPAYETNALVGGREVDVLVDGRLIVELDTFETHLLNFATDRDRDADILARTGIPTIRVMEAQFRQQPALLAERILAVLRGSKN